MRATGGWLATVPSRVLQLVTPSEKVDSGSTDDIGERPTTCTVNAPASADANTGFTADALLPKRPSTTPPDAKPDRLSRLREWFAGLFHRWTQRRDHRWSRRTLAWGFATTTGVLALVLMLVWQLTNFGLVAAVEEPESKEPPSKEQSEKSQPVVSKTAKSSGQIASKSDDQSMSIQWRAGPDLSQQEPKSTEPDNAEPDNTEAPIADARSPFGPPESPPPVSASPYATDPPKKSSGDHVAAPFQTQPSPTVAELPSMETPHAMSVEIIRVGPTAPPARDDSFLVTSLGTQSSGTAKTDTIPPLVDTSGWVAVSPTGKPADVVPARHGRQASVAQATSRLTIQAVSSVATSWAVDAPPSKKLTLEIVGVSKATLGELLRIRLRVTNSGSVAATSVKVAIDLPSHLEYHAGRKLTHSMGVLKPGETRVAQLTPRGITVGVAVIEASATTDDGRSTAAEKRIEIAR